MTGNPLAASLVSVWLLACAAHADPTLDGRRVTLNVLTYDDPAKPLLESIGRTVTVGPGIEFGMGPEGWTNGLDVVPVQVEIGPDRIEFSYGEGPGTFWTAAFNGYVVRFAGDCALFSGARIDGTATTMQVGDADIRVGPQALYINVAGRDYGPDKRLALDLKVEDCPLS
ncbi:MAG: hypothetical protein QM656_03815 [Paracoccaceae bacterium]